MSLTFSVWLGNEGDGRLDGRLLLDGFSGQIPFGFVDEHRYRVEIWIFEDQLTDCDLCKWFAFEALSGEICSFFEDGA